MNEFLVTNGSFWQGAGIASLVVLVVCIVISRLLIKQKETEIENQTTEERAIQITKSEYLKKQNEELHESLIEKDKIIQDLHRQNTMLETTLKVEKESIEKQIVTLEKAKEEMSFIFKAAGQEALQANNKTFLDLAKENLEKMQLQANENLEKKEKAIETLIKPVSESLDKMDKKINELEKERQGAYERLTQHLGTMAEDQQKLRSETSHLVQALRSPSSKGRWGEMHLRNTVEIAGLVNHVDFIEQDSFNDDGKIKRPDMIVRMPGGQKIIVDAKAPIDAYYDALNQNLDGAAREHELARLSRLVREHIKILASKNYWDQFESPEFVVMFLPSEGILSAAMEKDTSLLQYAIEQKVIPATPTTLIALLRAIGYGWQQEKIAENAREIADLGSELYRRLATFGEHLQSVGRGLGGALNSYNKAVGSLEGSVLPSARRFNELHVATKAKEIPVLTALDQHPRDVSAPELLVGPEETKKHKKA